MSERFIHALENYGVDRFLENLGAESITGSGSDYRSTCPVHKGDNSTALHYHNGFFTCFADCKKTYNPPSLMASALGISYQDALKRMESLLNASYDENEQLKILEDHYIDDRLFIRYVKNRNEAKKREEQAIYDLSNSKVYCPILHKNLEREGFTEKTRRDFDLRVGMVGYYKDRIIIPIRDKQSSVLGVAARSTLPNKKIDMLGMSKYIFSKGLKKGKLLYNQDRAKLSNKPFIIVVEGYKSVWRLNEWGYDNAVAVMGAKPTEEQIKLLLKMGKPLVISGDNDSAGRQMEDYIYRHTRNYTYAFKFDIKSENVNKKDSIAEITKTTFEKKLKTIMD